RLRLNLWRCELFFLGAGQGHPHGMMGCYVPASCQMYALKATQPSREPALVLKKFYRSQLCDPANLLLIYLNNSRIPDPIAPAFRHRYHSFLYHEIELDKGFPDTLKAD